MYWTRPKLPTLWILSVGTIMRHTILIHIICIFSWLPRLTGQEMMVAVPNAGIPAMEVSGRVVSIGGEILFVGRTGVWRLIDSPLFWEQQYQLPAGNVIIASCHGVRASLPFMDSKRNIWRFSTAEGLRSIEWDGTPHDSYLMSESSDGLLVVGNNRVLGGISADLLLSAGQRAIAPLFPPLRNISILSLEFNSRCERFILMISGQDPESPSNIKHQQYKLEEFAWHLIDTPQERPTVTAQLPNMSFILSNNELFKTAACPPVVSGKPVLRINNVRALSRISDSTLGLFEPYTRESTSKPIYIVNSNTLRIVDSIIAPPGEVLIDVVPRGDILYVQCQQRILAYRDKALVATIPWPSSKVPAVFQRAVSDGVSATLFGSGQLPPHVLTVSNGAWKPLYAIGADTVQITVIDGACQFLGVTYLWHRQSLFVSDTQDTRGHYFRVVNAPRFINHVRPVSDGRVLVLLETRAIDSTESAWHTYSHTNDSLVGYPDNWPRGVTILPITESVFNEASRTVIAGTTTYWLDGRTDTSQYPLYGLLKRNEQESDWTMSNEGLSTSLRCYALKQDKHGVVYLLSGYADGTTSYPRPSVFYSTNLGGTWTQTPTSMPADLSKNVRMSVTENGVFVHEKNCYRIRNGGEDVSPVDFSVGDVGEIFSMINGVDSTQMIMVTSTGVYNVRAAVSQARHEATTPGNVSIDGRVVTVYSDEVVGEVGVSVVALTGQTVHKQQVPVDDRGMLRFTLPSHLSVGVYLAVVGRRSYTVVYNSQP